MIAEESTDDGRSWQVIGSVSHAPETAHRGLGEPHLVEAADGRLVGLFRIGGIEPDDRFVFQSTSADGGHTWTPARQSYSPVLSLGDEKCIFDALRATTG